MKEFLIVFFGGGLGAGLRHMSGQVSLRLMGPSFPWGTLFVNVFGSLLMGLFIGWLVRPSAGTPNDIRLFFATGVLGGFTTFSAFSLDVANLWERGSVGLAAAYVTASLVLAVAAVFAGLAIMRSV